MSKEHSAQDPLEFVRGMWNGMGFSLPGMMTPTLDTGELDKRIGDLKAVENWLKMNTNMLQMTIQGLEVQRAALAAVKAMSQHAAMGEEAMRPGEDNPFAAAAMWPWNFMKPQETAAPQQSEPEAAEAAKAARRAAPRARAQRPRTQPAQKK